MPADLGFTFIGRNNEFQIFHHGKKATTLRGQKAADFREEVENILGKGGHGGLPDKC